MDAAAIWKDFGQALDALQADGPAMEAAEAANPWFTGSLIREAIAALRPWFDQDLALPEAPASHPRRIGIVMAGNLPLVGFHDLLMVLLAGHRAEIKPSSKDIHLLEALIRHLDPALQSRIRLHTALDPAQIDALIATGSDNTARYLQYHFAKVPMILRKNRFSVAVLTGNESYADWEELAKDILLYHGMGCRSVSNLLVPPDFDPQGLWEALDAFPKRKLAEEWERVVRWEKAIRGMQSGGTDGPERMVWEQGQLLGPTALGTLRAVNYEDADALQKYLEAADTRIQCVVGEGRPIAFGESQSPGPWDFADGVDTYHWLCRELPL